MARLRSRSGAGALGGALLLLLTSACHVAGARVWNLEQLHDPDGRPRRRANLHGDLEHLLVSGFQRSNFGGEDFRSGLQAQKRIADPYGKCLANVLALGDCRADARVVVQQALAFAWLACDCTYALSRERCVLELDAVLGALGTEGAPAELPARAAGPEDLAAHLKALIEATRGVMAAPALGTAGLEQAATALGELELDRQGALRAARAALALTENRETAAEFEALRRLRTTLARRCAALALIEARSDPSGRVRAAALEVGTRRFPAQRAELLRAALTGAPGEVSEPQELRLRALELLAANGLPPAPAGQDPEAFREGWNELLVQALLGQADGRTTLAATRALARLNQRPENPRPEVWVAWWRARRASAGDGSGGEG